MCISIHAVSVKIVYNWSCSVRIQFEDKKVLLRKRKRHTDRIKFSICYPILGGGGTPSMAGGTPILTWLRVLHPRLGGVPLSWGTPSPSWPGWGYTIPGWGTCHPDLAGGTPYWGTPCQDWGTPLEGTWDQLLGYPLERTWDQWKYNGMEMGYPPGCKQTHTCENITFPHPFGMRAVKNRS